VADSESISPGDHGVGGLFPINVSGGELKGFIDTGESREDHLCGSSGGGEVSIEIPVGDVLGRKEGREKKQY
jgi:hypothetical protein